MVGANAVTTEFDDPKRAITATRNLMVCCKRVVVCNSSFCNSSSSCLLEGFVLILQPAYDIINNNGAVFEAWYLCKIK